MCNKSFVFLRYMLVLTLTLFIGLGCNAQRIFFKEQHDALLSSEQYETLERFADDGESEIVIIGPLGNLSINGQKLNLRVFNRESATIVVPNGKHTICVVGVFSNRCIAATTTTIDLMSERTVIVPERVDRKWHLSNAGQFPLCEN